jgi:hypothetical protein
MVNYFNEIYYNASLLSKPNEFDVLFNLLQEMYLKAAQAPVSELVNLHEYTITRGGLRAKRILNSDGYDYPFEFVCCIN